MNHTHNYKNRSIHDDEKSDKMGRIRGVSGDLRKRPVETSEKIKLLETIRQIEQEENRLKMIENLTEDSIGIVNLPKRRDDR